MTVVVKAENISKRYRLGATGTHTLKGDFQRWWALRRGKEDPLSMVMEESQIKEGDFWALRNINFEIRQGEAVGIIGKNGAGKSTLLKLLSRITLPTTGTIKIKGRIASLLEVGTGFNPELSGRENVYLNGAILGMTRAEVKQKFDEIVHFSGVEKFIDTPVKRYSSGMYVRLAFAVAAHLDSEILILDEVLAVGDAEFQKKCLRKMDDVTHKQGRTVLFVSHDLASVQSLCDTAIVLRLGQVVCQKTDSESAVRFYNRSVVGGSTSVNIGQREDRQGSGKLRFQKIEFLDKEWTVLDGPICGHRVFIRLHHVAYENLNNVGVAVGFNSWTGENKLLISSEFLDTNYNNVTGTGFFECQIDKFPLAPGKYLVNVFSRANGEILDWVQEAMEVVVELGDFYGTGKNNTTHQSVLIEHQWN